MQAQGFPLRRHPALAERAAAWFSAKWGLPQQSYRDSIRACLGRDAGVPQWYVVPDGKGGIAAGAGLIENDFHDRPTLLPTSARCMWKGHTGAAAWRGRCCAVSERTPPAWA